MNVKSVWVYYLLFRECGCGCLNLVWVVLAEINIRVGLEEVGTCI